MSAVLLAAWAFVRANWKPFAIIAVALVIWLALHRYGDARYSQGRADEKAVWVPQLVAAEKARAAADARTTAIDTASKNVVAEQEARHAETIAALNARAAGADRRFRALGVRLAAANSRRCELPAMAGSQPGDAGAAESQRRAAEIGSAIGAVGRDCADDAARLQFFIDFYRQQTALRAPQ